MVRSLISWTNAIRWVGGSLAGLLAVDSILYRHDDHWHEDRAKKQEVEVLNLVGASPWYIRMPFLLEGGLYGLIGAGIAGLIIAGLTLWLYPFLLSVFRCHSAYWAVLGHQLRGVFAVRICIFGDLP